MDLQKTTLLKKILVRIEVLFSDWVTRGVFKYHGFPCLSSGIMSA